MNKQKSTEQTKKQQKTWMKVLKIVGIVLLCLILFAVIAFGVLRALGKSGIRKNISGEAPQKMYWLFSLVRFWKLANSQNDKNPVVEMSYLGYNDHDNILIKL